MPASRRLELASAAGGAVLITVIAVLSLWAHYSLSTATLSAGVMARPASTATVAAPPDQLRAWLNEAKIPIDAVAIEGDTAITTATRGDLARTAAACQNLAAAVAGAQRWLPSPDPALNAVLQQAFTDYAAGIRHCSSGTQRQNAVDIGLGMGFISHGNAELDKAYAVIADDLAADHKVLTA